MLLLLSLRQRSEHLRAVKNSWSISAKFIARTHYILFSKWLTSGCCVQIILRWLIISLNGRSGGRNCKTRRLIDHLVGCIFRDQASCLSTTFDSGASASIAADKHRPKCSCSQSGGCALTLSPPIPLRLYTLPYWSNPPFLIFDIRALWRSGLSARVPECQKLKMVG